MKKELSLFIIFGVIAILLFQFNGCYTQLGSTKDEYVENEEYVAPESEQEYEAENTEGEEAYVEGCCYDDYRSHVGFTFYYPMNYWPSSAFSYAYNNIWTYDYYGGWYDPWYSWGYNPWYYSSYYSPYYSPYNYPFYYPYYSNPWGNYYGYEGQYVNVGRRDFGDVCAGGTDRRVGGNQWDGTTGLRDDVPASSRVMRAPDGASAASKRTGTTETAREKSSIRDSDNRWNSGSSDRKSNSTESGTKIERRQTEQTREKTPQVRTERPAARTPSKDSGTGRKPGKESVRSNSSRSQTPRYTPQRNSSSQPSSGVRSGSGSSRSQTPSYTPPSSSSPRSSSPPSSSGSRSGSSNRGSSSGGRRP